MNIFRFLRALPRLAQYVLAGIGRAARPAMPVTLAVALAIPGALHAQTIALDASNTQIGYTVEALGLVPVHGFFQQFHGVISRNPAQPAACQVDVTIQVASLKMDDPARRREALEPDMLDAAHFPTMRFSGACGPSGLAGTLAMHGVSQPLTLHVRRAHGQMVGTATLRRQDYGVNGLPDLVGPRVVIALTTPPSPTPGPR